MAKIRHGVGAEKIKSTRKIMVVDDHPLVCQGLVQLLNQEPGWKVCGHTGNTHCVSGMIGELNPDLVIIDISLKTMNGIELVKDIRIHHPSLPIVVFSMHDESLYAERALRAGAQGYVMKREAPEKLLAAVRQVMRGGVHVSEAIGSRILSHFIHGSPQPGGSRLDRLTDRELEIFRLIGRGCATRQIASELRLSIKTVESYREHIKRKLLIKSSPELIQHAIQWMEGECMTG